MIVRPRGAGAPLRIVERSPQRLVVATRATARTLSGFTSMPRRSRTRTLRRTRSAIASRGRPAVRRTSATPRGPLSRPLRIYTLDPSVSDRIGGVATVQVPYEKLEPGPSRLAVQDQLRRRARAAQGGAARSRRSAPAAVERPRAVAGQRALPPADGLRRLQPHLRGVQARARPGDCLGDRAGRGRPASAGRCGPSGFAGANAGYSREAGDLSFGYFTARRETRRVHPAETA